MVQRLGSDLAEDVTTRFRDLPEGLSKMATYGRLETMKAFADLLSPRHARCDFYNFETKLPEQALAKQRMLDWVDSYPRQFCFGEGVILFGPCGTGKDHLAAASVRRLILHYGCHFHPSHRYANSPSLFDDEADDPRRSVDRISGDQLFHQMRKAIGADDPEDVVDRWVAPSVLVLSDPIGTVATRVTDARLELLSAIIGRRYDLMRPTIITINAKGSKHLGELLTEPLADRLRDQAVAIECFWESYRRAKA